ncbi:MAG TPA: ABC transporter permease [Polyangia bacterium]|jgi:putative ABC transport system permease protein
MRDLLGDLKFALRMLRRSPGVTAAAVLALALGIGANTAIFSVVDGVLLRPLAYPESSQLVAVYRGATHFGFTKGPWSFPDFKDFLAQNQSFENAGIWSGGDGNLSGNGSPERVLIRLASPTLLPTLRVAPIAGRNFLPGEAFKGNDHVALLDYKLAQRRFGTPNDALGKTVRIDGVDYQVVGVLPRGFFLETAADVWMPASTTFDMLQVRNAHWLRMIARKKPGLSNAQIQSDLDGFSKRLVEAHGDIYPASMGLTTTIEPFIDQIVGDVRLPLLILLGAVAFVLLIACANVANLLLARAATRNREMAIRTALGAGRARLMRQLLTESLLLAFAGAGLGLVFAAWAVDGLVSLAPDALPRAAEVALDGRVLAFTIAVAAGTGIAFGLMPALSASRPDLHDALKDGTRGTTSARGRLRKALVIAEVALSLVLLVGTGLMVRSFVRLRSVDPGFRADHALALSISLPVADSKVTDADKERFARFFTDADARIAQLPGVTAVGGSNIMPLSNNTTDLLFEIEGFTPADPADKPDCESREVAGDWFGAMGIPLVRGRTFAPSDSLTAAPVVIVNQAWVKKYSPDRDALGRHVRQPGSREPNPPWATIVGVIGDVRGYGLDKPARAELYWPLTQRRGSSAMTLVARTSGDPLALAGAARGAIAEVDPQQPIFDVMPLDNVVAQSLAQRRFTLTLMMLFGIVALLLAAVGIYGVMSYTVAQRTQEIGIRVALGATAGIVLGMVLKDGMKLVAIGLAVGAAAALVLTRVGASLLWGISSTDALTYVAVAVALALVALVAIVVPARRATRVDPMQALRSE